MSTEEALAKIAEYSKKIDTDLTVMVFAMMIVAIACVFVWGGRR